MIIEKITKIIDIYEYINSKLYLYNNYEYFTFLKYLQHYNSTIQRVSMFKVTTTKAFIWTFTIQAYTVQSIKYKRRMWYKRFLVLIIKLSTPFFINLFLFVWGIKYTIYSEEKIRSQASVFNRNKFHILDRNIYEIT